jgi:hypothetical protein
MDVTSVGGVLVHVPVVSHFTCTQGKSDSRRARVLARSADTQPLQALHS